MAKKLKHIEVNCPVFKCDLHYIVDCDYKDLEKYLKKRFNFQEDLDWLAQADGTAMVLSGDDSLYRIVWLEDASMTFKHIHSRIGVLAHETVHAVLRILDHKGIPYSSTDNQDETFAYLVDYFISNFIYHYKRKK